MTFQRTRRDALNSAPTYDLKNVGLGEALERLEQHVGWHIADGPASRTTLKTVTTLAQAIAAVNAMSAVYTVHMADDVAHDAADATNVITEPDATDLTTANALATEMKAVFNAHIADTTPHALVMVDVMNTVTSADATTLATLLALVSEMQVKYRNHTFRGPIQIDEVINMGA